MSAGARELGPRKIRVNSLDPGPVEIEGTKTASTTGPDSEMEKWIIPLKPLGRVGRPGDIASIAVFLTSDDSGWLTGEHLFATGGVRLSHRARSGWGPNIENVCP